MKRNLEFPKFSVFDSLGNPLSGGKVYFYEAGTSTLKDTYSDPEGTIKNSNPVILDSRGEADIYLDRDPYKIVVKDASDVTVMTRDNYQAYMAADDAPVENLLINADARSNENGYVSGTAVVAGDDIYDAWTCAADGTITFVAEGDISLPLGVKIQHTNDDMAAMTGETVTLSVKSGSVEVTGFGLISVSVISVDNPITFVADGANPIVLGGGNMYTFSGLTLVKGNAATNTIRRPYLLEKFLCEDYIAILRSKIIDAVANIISKCGVVARANITVNNTSTITINHGVYRLTTTADDALVRIASSPVTVTIDYDIAGSPGPPGGNVAYLYLLDTAVTATQPINDAAYFRLCPEWTPTYNEERQGWYYNDNRCIGVFVLNPSTSELLQGDIVDGKYILHPSAGRNGFTEFTVVPTVGTEATGTVQLPGNAMIFMAHVQCSFSVAPTAVTNFYFTDSTYTNTNGYLYNINGFPSGLYNNADIPFDIAIKQDNGNIYAKYGAYIASGQVWVHVKGYTWDNAV